MRSSFDEPTGHWDVDNTMRLDDWLDDWLESCTGSVVVKYPVKKTYFELNNETIKFAFPEPGHFEGVESRSCRPADDERGFSASRRAWLMSLRWSMKVKRAVRAMVGAMGTMGSVGAMAKCHGCHDAMGAMGPYSTYDEVVLGAHCFAT